MILLSGATTGITIGVIVIVILIVVTLIVMSIKVVRVRLRGPFLARSRSPASRFAPPAALFLYRNDKPWSLSALGGTRARSTGLESTLSFPSSNGPRATGTRAGASSSPLSPPAPPVPFPGLLTRAFPDFPPRLPPLSYRYYITDARGRPQLQHKKNQTTILLSAEVLDYPAQRVITRDNATLQLDAVLGYRIINPKVMIYSVQNLPDVLGKLLQAQLRNVAGALDVDQIIEQASSLNVLTGLMATETTRWGVEISFVKVQGVQAPGLTDVLAAKKNADLNNREVVIEAKSYKQTQMIESEGQRDSMVKKAEGHRQEIISKSKGEAQAIINMASGEARNLREMARGIVETGVDVAQYVLRLKYIEAMQAIVSSSGTDVVAVPKQTEFLQTAQDLGLTVFAGKLAKID